MLSLPADHLDHLDDSGDHLDHLDDNGDHLDHNDDNGDHLHYSDHNGADLVVKCFELQWQTIKHYLKTVRSHLFDAGSKYPIRRAVNPCSQLNG